MNLSKDAQREDIARLSSIPNPLKILHKKLELKKNRVNAEQVLRASSEETFNWALAQIPRKTRYFLF